MLKLLFIATVMILALLGLSELIHIIHALCIKPKGKRRIITVVVLEENKAVEDLYFAAVQSAWFGKTFCEYRIAVYDSLDTETYNICKNIADKYDFIFCPREVLDHIITTLSDNCR